MSSIEHFSHEDITKKNRLFSNIRSVIETAFYGNNVTRIRHLTDAYALAKKSPGTITTDLSVAHTNKLQLPTDAKVLVTNDGNIVGRTAAARRIVGQEGIDADFYSELLREAVFQSRDKQFYSGDVLVGLDEEFTVKAHLMLPADYSPNLYSYLLNFQIGDAKHHFYQESKTINTGDLFLFADPDWQHPDFPDGVVVIDPKHNCAGILGLRYFGELKKATLTLAWATAHRNGFIACHGGMKQYLLENKKYTMAAFGLSGSGKSTITLAKPKNKGEVHVLHDDAFVISKDKGSTTALEPAYFDKTQDYPMTSEQIKYIVTAQNVGVTLDEDNKKVLVTEDIRNGNGRSIKSRYATPNRVDHIAEKVDGLFWIMKDDSLPPLIKIEDPSLAAIFGATLATKRSTAENVVGEKSDQLVIEPFANPFRCYPLQEDYQDFKELFEKQQTACFILNTGDFKGQKVTPEQTLSSIEKIIDGSASFKPFGPLDKISYLPVKGHEPNFDSQHYLLHLMSRLETRLAFVQSRKTFQGGYDRLPNEAEQLLLGLLDQLNSYKETINL
ncbi:phosphoenolpyruvate carboxykinase (ATP) [Enterococcus devriesei]|uniref:phosphoenolpyruvate carboxykinase (ATP) n=1 Tax=Enterococcus devriesei TaxID=319970 RepID=UPI001C113997|nr:phosphoenolpyruvate carboxykinase (ATP) [Enterococcus devriesei]MBU5364730.1 phosphoenolpyruvate carboxykinase (ATP) [Enterococcus devriesei]